MNYQQGDIVIVNFPFSDLSAHKKRPALIISNELVNRTGDYLMVQITSKMRNDGFSLPLTSTDYVKNKPLPLQSWVRFHKMFLLSERLILTKYTRISKPYTTAVMGKVIQLLT